MIRTDFADADLDPHSPAESSSPMAEHAIVRLSSSLTLEDGRRLPPGARGAIVFVHGAGAAYGVEFLASFHAIATVMAADLPRDRVA